MLNVFDLAVSHAVLQHKKDAADYHFRINAVVILKLLVDSG
jgi:hypothetical protein